MSTEPAGTLFCILFNGQLRHGARRDTCLQALKQLTNHSEADLLEVLFSIKPVIINQVEGNALAEEYRNAFSECGLEVWIETTTESHDEIVNAELNFGHYAPLKRTETAPNYILDLNQADTTANSRWKPEGSIAKNSDPGTQFTVIFDGALVPNFSKANVIENVGHLTNSVPERVVEELFSVVPVIVIQSDNKETAERYIAAFNATGMLVRLHEGDLAEETAVSTLSIREDVPAPRQTRQTLPFTYALLGIAGLALFAWVLIFVFMDGFFSHRPETSLRIELQPAPTGEKFSDVAQPPLPTQSANPIDERTQEKPTANERAATEKINDSPKGSADQVRVRTSAEKLAVEQNYYMELLSWFARPDHQGYDSETRKLNLEGEIELEISIARDGTLQQVSVNHSSSEQLTVVTTETARRASPYPKVPDEISGSVYRFRLPLKYTLEEAL